VYRVPHDRNRRRRAGRLARLQFVIDDGVCFDVTFGTVSIADGLIFAAAP